MKIAYVTTSILPSMTANSVHVMKMCQAFSDLGHQVTLITPEFPGRELKVDESIFSFYGVKDSFKIVKIPRSKLIRPRFVGFMLKTRSYINSERFDLVFGRSLHGIFAAKNSVNKSLEIHVPIQQFSKLDRFLFDKLSTHTNYRGTVVISEALKSMCQESSEYMKSKFIVAHDGADEIQNIHNVPLMQSGELNIGYLGSLYEGRGIEVIAALATKYPKHSFHIIGGSPKEVDYNRKKFLLTNLCFYGHVAPKEVSSYQMKMDILLAPYQRKVSTVGKGNETSKFMSPIKLFEYMATGKPIISSDFVVLREFLNPQNSVLVECDNMGEWIQSIAQLEDESVRDAIAQQALKDFLEKHTWRARARGILESLA